MAKCIRALSRSQLMRAMAEQQKRKNKKKTWSQNQQMGEWKRAAFVFCHRQIEQMVQMLVNFVDANLATPIKNGHNRLVSVVCLIKCFVNNHWFWLCELCVPSKLVILQFTFSDRCFSTQYRFGDGDDAQFVRQRSIAWNHTNHITPTDYPGTFVYK